MEHTWPSWRQSSTSLEHTSCGIFNAGLLVFTSRLGLTELETHSVLKENRAEGNRGLGESARPAADIAVKQKLIDNLLANLRSRFPQNKKKFRLIVVCYHVVDIVLA